MHFVFSNRRAVCRVCPRLPASWQQRLSQLFQERIVLRRCRLNRSLDFLQRFVRSRQINLLLTHRSADVAGDVQIEVVLFDLRHFDPAGVARLLFAELVGLDDLGDVPGLELVLAFALLKVFGGVDEEHNSFKPPRISRVSETSRQ